MSWRIDSELLLRLVEAIRRNVDDEKTKIDIYSEMILALEDVGCDIIEEIVGEDPAFDEAFAAVGSVRDDEDSDFLEKDEDY